MSRIRQLCRAVGAANGSTPAGAMVAPETRRPKICDRLTGSEAKISQKGQRTVVRAAIVVGG